MSTGRRLRGHDALGLVSAAAVASRGFDDVCFDAERRAYPPLGAAGLPVLEPGLDDLIAQQCASDSVSPRARPISASCDVVYVAPDIPTDDQGRSDVAAIHGLIDDVAADARPEAVMVVLSQVPPGFTRALQAPVPPQRLYYQVETLVFGRAVERATKPERYIVGCADPGGSARSALPRRARGVRLPDPADALRERRAGQDLDQLAASWPRSASPIRWRRCASRSAPTGRRSCRR